MMVRENRHSFFGERKRFQSCINRIKPDQIFEEGQDVHRIPGAVSHGKESRAESYQNSADGITAKERKMLKCTSTSSPLTLSLISVEELGPDYEEIKKEVDTRLE